VACAPGALPFQLVSGPFQPGFLASDQTAGICEQERQMIRNLVVVVSGSALALALAGVASPAVAWGSVHPAGVTTAKLFNPGDPPIIRRSQASVPVRALTAQADTPVVRDSVARPGGPGPVTIWNPGDPPVITRSKAGGPARALRAQAEPPTVRDSAARLGDPDDGGQ